jgi:hypothetical protein
MSGMTHLLLEAIDVLRELPSDAHVNVARRILKYLASHEQNHDNAEIGSPSVR